MESKSAESKDSDGVLADGVYDVIILGTGLKECLAGCLLMMEGHDKVLFIDENSYYGGTCASLRPSDLGKLAGKSELDERIGRDGSFAIDLAPKLIMSRGRLLDLMLKTNVTEYMDFHKIEGSFVYKHPQKIHKVPATSVEATKTPLVTMMQKRKLRNFIKNYLEEKEEEEESKSQTTKELFDQAGLEEQTQAFVGHAMALDDKYKDKPASETLRALRLYAKSLSAYGDSPFIYPCYGVGTIAEAFSRKCAVIGATFMLHTPVDEVEMLEDEDMVQVTSNGRVAKAKLVIADPSYAKTIKTKNEENLLGPRVDILRSICILDAKPKCCTAENSAQIIIPQSQINRSHDVYMTYFSKQHQVCPEGFWVCVCSTVKENDFSDLDTAVKLLGDPSSIIERFDIETPAYLNTSMKSESRILLSNSYDATTHFESTMADIDRIVQAALDQLDKVK